MTPNRFICIHGHFYQPARENPWTKEIEIQPTAMPYQNWNERIAAECYIANTRSPILGDKDSVLKTVNNYASMSFDFGPTLLSWLSQKAPEAYQAILEADKISLEKFGGHGSGMAQAYNHMIMPLANDRDKRTQIIWGVKDFEYRFNRKPDGMWLPETAVDVKTLELLVEYGIQYTVLSPFQALKVRKIDEHHWHDVPKASIDTRQPYRLDLPSGKEINLFFYNGEIANQVAFGEILKNGEDFAYRMLNEFNADSTYSQLVHIATDGETYGHHHMFGNMALAYFLDFIETHQLAQVTNYSQYLAMHPPQHEVQIEEDSSWSCRHGVERWRADCGCRIDTEKEKMQEWREPLREALDWLRDEMTLIYEQKMGLSFDAPWQVRDEYIQLILNRSFENVNHFFRNFANHKLSHQEKINYLRFLEMQRYAMLMYTSCGWFFDDIAGLETRQILQYAAKAIQLTKEVANVDLEENFLELLKAAESNDPKMQHGKRIYEVYVKPNLVLH